MKENNKNTPQKNFVLDKYEQSIEEALEKGEFVSVENLKDSKNLFKEATKVFRDLQKTKRITLRVNKEDLIRVKAKAKKSGIPYQRLIRTLIRQYAEGKTNIVI